MSKPVETKTWNLQNRKNVFFKPKYANHYLTPANMVILAVS